LHILGIRAKAPNWELSYFWEPIKLKLQLFI
jgi:hypothetical protein